MCMMCVCARVCPLSTRTEARAKEKKKHISENNKSEK